MRRWTQIGYLVLILIAITGCQGNQYATVPSNGQQIASQAAIDWNARLDKLDRNNREMHAQLAQSQQQVQILKDQLSAVQTRLGETAKQLSVAQETQRTTESQFASLQATTRRRGGATIRANSSLQTSLKMASFNIPGVTARQDGDVIRISISSDQLFQPGTTQLQPAMFSTLDSVSSLIARHYARQRVGIEAHTDSGVARPGTDHQVTSYQAMAVLQYFTTRANLPGSQFFTVAQGNNHPVSAQSGTTGAAENRRIEVVVYPETF